MKIDQDVKRFVDAIGAKELSPDNDNCSDIVGRLISAIGREFLFKRHNYFQLNKKWMIIKISRNEKPFWGVGKKFINLMNHLDDYYLVLLVSSQRDMCFQNPR